MRMKLRIMAPAAAFLVLFGLQATRVPDPSVAGARAAAAFARLPLAFEKDGSDGGFVARGHGYGIGLSPSGAALSLRRGKETAPLRLRFPGGDPTATLKGLEPLPGHVSYFLGDDPSKWRRNISTYARVRAEGLYPGVDLEYYGNQGQLEFDLVVSPGADPGKLRVGFDGIDRLDINEEGDLTMTVAGETVLQKKPIVFQETSKKRVPVEGRYVLTGTREVGFGIGAYDRALSLVIDPVIVYSTFLGGNAIDRGIKVVVDASGSAYVCGTADSINFPSTAGGFDPTPNGPPSDAVVVKFNAAGDALVFAAYLGGNGEDRGGGLAVDAAGHVYVAGFTRSSDFPATAGSFDTTPNGDVDAYVTKIDASGSFLLYSSYLGGGLGDAALALDVDVAGNCYVTGYTISANFPTTAGAVDTTSNGNYDAFVTKVNPAGSALVYSTYLGGGTEDYGSALSVDAAGNAYVAGYTLSPGFPTTPGAFDTTFNGNYDAFVTKLDPAGSTLAYSTYLGGASVDLGLALAIDASGSAYVSGGTGSAAFPTTPGAFDTVFNGGGADAFVTKIDPAGATLAYSTFLGGAADDYGNGILVVASGEVYLAGYTLSPGFPTTLDALDASWNGANDIFLLRLHAAGSAVLFSTFLGGALDDLGHGIAMDASGFVYVTGDTRSVGWPTTPGAYDTSHNGNFDAFLLKTSFNVAPAVLLGPAATVVLNQSYAGTVTFTDAGSTGWDVSVDFGDLSPGLAVNGITSPFTFNHTFASTGTFTVTATVTDNQGAAGSNTVQVAVITAQAALANLKTDLGAKTLDARYKSVLNAILDRALALINMGQPARAVSQLSSFLNYVARYEAAGYFSPSGSSASLVGAANELIDALTP